jgi:hypothetical protein
MILFIQFAILLIGVIGVVVHGDQNEQQLALHHQLKNQLFVGLRGSSETTTTTNDVGLFGSIETNDKQTTTFSTDFYGTMTSVVWPLFAIYQAQSPYSQTLGQWSSSTCIPSPISAPTTLHFSLVPDTTDIYYVKSVHPGVREQYLCFIEFTGMWNTYETAYGSDHCQFKLPPSRNGNNYLVVVYHNRMVRPYLDDGITQWCLGNMNAVYSSELCIAYDGTDLCEFVLKVTS